MKKISSRKEFITPKARLPFTRLMQAFTDTPIQHHFLLERYIYIEINAFAHVIGGIVSQVIPGPRFSDLTYDA